MSSSTLVLALALSLALVASPALGNDRLPAILDDHGQATIIDELRTLGYRDDGSADSLRLLTALDARDEAVERNRPMMVFFLQSECGRSAYCTQLKHDLVHDATLRAALRDGDYVVAVVPGEHPLAKTRTMTPDGAYLPRVFMTTPLGVVLPQVHNPLSGGRYQYSYESGASVVTALEKHASAFDEWQAAVAAADRMREESGGRYSPIKTLPEHRQSEPARVRNERVRNAGRRKFDTDSDGTLDEPLPAAGSAEAAAARRKFFQRELGKNTASQYLVDENARKEDMAPLGTQDPPPPEVVAAQKEWIAKDVAKKQEELDRRNSLNQRLEAAKRSHEEL